MKDKNNDVIMACSKASIVWSIILLVLSIISAFFAMYFALIILGEHEVDSAAAGIAFVFVFIVLLVPVLAASGLNVIFDIINIVIYSRMLKTDKAKYAKVGLVITIILLVAVVSAVVTMFVMLQTGNIVEVVTTTTDATTTLAP